MKATITWFYIQGLGAIVLLLYSVIVIYQHIGMWAVPVGTGVVLVFGAGIAYGARKSISIKLNLVTKAEEKPDGNL